MNLKKNLRSLTAVNVLFLQLNDTCSSIICLIQYFHCLVQELDIFKAVHSQELVGGFLGNVSGLPWTFSSSCFWEIYLNRMNLKNLKPNSSCHSHTSFINPRKAKAAIIMSSPKAFPFVNIYPVTSKNDVSSSLPCIWYFGCRNLNTLSKNDIFLLQFSKELLPCFPSLHPRIWYDTWFQIFLSGFPFLRFNLPFNT